MKKQKTNWVLTIVLILGTLTVFFPLYMAVIIAFKKPSEMTNDVAGALSFPSKWSFSNFTEAMKVTDFWHSLGNSLLITIVTIVLCNHYPFDCRICYRTRHGKEKELPFHISLHCKRYVCAILNSHDASCKADCADGTWKQGRSYHFISCIFTCQ